MRILVISQLPPFVVGGAERQAARLIEQWRDAGHEVMCFGREMRGRTVAVGAHRIPIRRIRVLHALGRWPRGLSYALSLAWLLLRHRRWPDIVYCRFFGEAATVAALLKAAGLLRVPLVAVPANAGPGGDTGFLRSVPGHAALARLLDRHCDAINLIAAQMEHDLVEFGIGGRRFERIPNGVAVGPAPRRRWDGPRIVVTVCRLAAPKQVDRLLEAFAAARASTDARLRIVGDGPLRAELQALAQRLGLGDRVDFVGLAGEAQVRAELDAAHLFALPSRNEGFSNAALEAMERGLPVLVSACGGIDRHVGADRGWVVAPGDQAALERALGEALRASPESLAAMGARCRAEVEREFDLRVVAARNLELFGRLHRGRPAEASGRP